jgi:DNA-directed RNA polymerase specialized sigma24 family protein
MAPEATSTGGLTVGELRRDRHTFEAALDRWYPVTIRLARSLVQDEQTAHEIARQTWTDAATRLPQFDANADVSTLLLRATVETASGRLDVPTRYAAVPTVNFEPASSRWAGWWSGAPRPVLEDGKHQRLVGALSKLAPAVGAMVTLRDVEGLPESQVKSVLGFAPDAQQALLHAGRLAIWQALVAVEAGL